jgi:hypothetical protein
MSERLKAQEIRDGATSRASSACMAGSPARSSENLMGNKTKQGGVKTWGSSTARSLL